MPNELPIPDELQHLLEKRDSSDRRQSERRQPDNDAGVPETDRRSGTDRRKNSRRNDDAS